MVNYNLLVLKCVKSRSVVSEQPFVRELKRRLERKGSSRDLEKSLQAVF